MYPTDTQYGLGVLAGNRGAVERVIEVKRARRDKTVSVIVSDIEMAEKYVFVSDKARRLMEKYLPGALTLILPSKDKNLAKSCGNEHEIGVRIPDQKEILQIVSELSEPITTTSANISGVEPKTDCKYIINDLKGIDLAIDGGELKGEASTIVKLSGSDCEIVRQGSLAVVFE